MIKVNWETIITEAFKNLGGHAKYKDLYVYIEENYYEKIKDRKNYKSAIRACIERLSSDSDAFLNKKDIYMMMGEKGDGHWGLRNISSKDIIMDYSDDDIGFPEGKKKLKIHLSRERNPLIIKKAKDDYLKKYGKLECQICKFNFAEVYGEVGEGFIEGHHVIPVSKLSEDSITKVSEIVLVCSNCHRMLHRKRPWLSPEKLSNLIIKKL